MESTEILCPNCDSVMEYTFEDDTTYRVCSACGYSEEHV